MRCLINCLLLLLLLLLPLHLAAAVWYPQLLAVMMHSARTHCMDLWCHIKPLSAIFVHSSHLACCMCERITRIQRNWHLLAHPDIMYACIFVRFTCCLQTNDKHTHTHSDLISAGAIPIFFFSKRIRLWLDEYCRLLFYSGIIPPTTMTIESRNRSSPPPRIFHIPSLAWDLLVITIFLPCRIEKRTHK